MIPRAGWRTRSRSGVTPILSSPEHGTIGTLVLDGDVDTVGTLTYGYDAQGNETSLDVDFDPESGLGDSPGTTVSEPAGPPESKSAFLLIGAVCLAGCSFGPPNLAPFLSEDTDGNRTFKAVFHVEGERLQSYRNPRMETSEAAMQYRNYNVFINPGYATRNLIITTYFNYLVLSPGIGLGWMREDFYLVAFVNSKFWIRDFEPAFQFGARFSENLNLSITWHKVEFLQWRRIEDPGPYALHPEEIIATEKQNVLKISPGFSVYHERLTISPSMMYAMGSRALGASISLSWVVESRAKPR